MSIETATERVYNFSAGPAVLPLSVLRQIQKDMLALPGVGSSILEISHRSADFVQILDDAKQRLIRLLDVPDTHEVIFLQGGARFQNAMIPMNLLTDRDQTADYIVSGAWGKKSAADVPFFGQLNVAWDGADKGYNRTPEHAEIKFTDNAAYCHLTSNETIHGVQFADYPDTGTVPLVSDCSSDFLSRPMDVSGFGMIYACAQKNAGTAGVTAVIIRKDLLERSGDRLPSYLDYSQHVSGGSMLNTPPTFSIYVLGLVCRWLEEDIGGLANMDALNRQKANMLYEVIDESDGFYIGHAKPESRSLMNVVFRLSSPEIDARFLEQARAQGMTTLKGHRSLGGIRASVYNAMPVEGVQALSDFMRQFRQQNG